MFSNSAPIGRTCCNKGSLIFFFSMRAIKLCGTFNGKCLAALLAASSNSSSNSSSVNNSLGSVTAFINAVCQSVLLCKFIESLWNILYERVLYAEFFKENKKWLFTQQAKSAAV